MFVRLIGTGLEFFQLRVAPGAPAGAEATITSQEALAAEEERFAAQMTGDIPALERLISDELVYVHSSTVEDTKVSFIESLRSGNVRYRTMERSDTVVRTYGSVAIITGKAQFGVTVRGQDLTLNLLYHAIWTKGSRGIQFISWQATRTSA